MFSRYSKTLSAMAAVMVLSVMAACATLVPQSFNEGLASGYVTVTTVRQLATTLVSSDIIKADDAANVQTQATEGRKGLDLARDLHKILPKAGEDKLESTLVSLQALHDYLLERQKGKK